MARASARHPPQCPHYPARIPRHRSAVPYGTPSPSAATTEAVRERRPGESVQIDVKVVKLRRETIYQCTALDDCTRLRVLRPCPRQNQHASLDFFHQVQAAMPFQI